MKEEVVERIEQLCNKKGIKLSALLSANDLRVKVDTFNKWKEDKKTSPNLNQIVKIAKHLEVPTEYLLFGIDLHKINLIEKFKYDVELAKIAEALKQENDLYKMFLNAVSADQEHRILANALLTSDNIDYYYLINSLKNDSDTVRLLKAARENLVDDKKKKSVIFQHDRKIKVNIAIKVIKEKHSYKYHWVPKPEYKYSSIRDYLNFLKLLIAPFLIFTIFTLLFFKIGNYVKNSDLKTSYNTVIEEFEIDQNNYQQEMEEYNKDIIAYNEKIEETESFNKTAIVPVTVSAKCSMTGGDPIGNEISYDLLVNDIDCRSKKEMEVRIGDEIRISSTVTDHEQIPDVGNANDSITIGIDGLKEGYSVIQKMYPHETRGKFAGNTAEYTAEYQIKVKEGFDIVNFENSLSNIVEPKAPIEPEKPDIGKLKKVASIHGVQLFGYSTTAVIIYLLIFALFIWYIAYKYYYYD